MKAHHAAGLGTLAALVIHDLVVEEEKQLLFAGVRLVAEKFTEFVQQPQPEIPAPMTYFGWPYYQRPQRDPFLGYRGYCDQGDPDP